MATKTEIISQLDFSPRRLTASEALSFRSRLAGESPNNILEICRDPSQITISLAALLFDQGKGTLTTFNSAANSGGKQAKRYLSEHELAPYVFSISYGRSYSWALERIVASDERQEFDICVLNGNKSWDQTSQNALMADMLLRPGGLMVLMDQNWSMADSPHFKREPELTKNYDTDELNSKPVKLTVDLVLSHLNYQKISAPELEHIAFSRKPL